MLTGPDVSDNQGSRVDWRAVAASNHAFAIARASSGFRLGDGSLYVDPSYQRNMEGMTAAGLVTGAYHYAYVTTTDARTQADHFCDATAAAKPHIYFLDLEEGSGDLSQWALQFMTRVQEGTGKRCGLYSGLFFASSAWLPTRCGLPTTRPGGPQPLRPGGTSRCGSTPAAPW